MSRRVVYALVLGAVTFGATGLAKTYVPDSHAKGVILDSLAMPGAILAGLYYTEGPHTGSGAPNWFLAVLILNFVIYSAVWFVLLGLVRHHRRRHTESTSTTSRPSV